MGNSSSKGSSGSRHHSPGEGSSQRTSTSGLRKTRSANSMNDASHGSPPPYNVVMAGSSSPLTDKKTSSPLSSKASLNRPHSAIGFSTPFSAEPDEDAARLAYLRAPMRKESQEDALEILRKFDTVIIVDDSKSMEGKLWKEAKKALASLADLATQYDTNGIDVHLLNNRETLQDAKSSKDIEKFFSGKWPQRATPIGAKLEELLLPYLTELEQAQLAGKALKPVNFIVITDGQATDAPEDVIVAAARRLDRGNFSITQVGIQFVQIGRSSEATKFLRDLDDSISSVHGIRDMVDTTPYNGTITGEMLIKILIGGINRRVDRRGADSV